MEDDAWVDVTPEGLMRELTSVTATLPLEDKSFQKAVVSAIKAIQTEDAGDDPTLTAHDSSLEHHCALCGKGEDDLAQPLKRCSGCQNVRYCSQKCQKIDRRMHRLICGDKASIPHLLLEVLGSDAEKVITDPKWALPTLAGTTNPQSSGLPSQFNATAKDDVLHDLPEKDALTFLIDSYRLRQDDEYRMTGDVDYDSICGGAGTSLLGFRRYLDLAQERKGLLPQWWNPEKRATCLQLGRKRGGWEDLSCAIEKSDIVEHYGNGLIPFKLRALAERVYEKGVMDDTFYTGNKPPWEE